MENSQANDWLEIGKSTGFTCMAVLGWLAWIPTAIFGIVIYVLLALLLAPVAWSLINFLGVNVTILLRRVLVITIGLLCMGLSRAGVPVSFDPQRFKLGNVPGMLLGSIFTLIRPNRFTFGFGSVVSAYLLVFELPRLLPR